MRGDIGIGWPDSGDFSQAELARNTGNFVSHEIGETFIVGAGVGVKIGAVRLDLTGEYRSPAKIEARDNLSVQIIAPNGTLQANTDYQAKLESLVGLINAYVDLGTWNGITPYVGGGIGIAHNTIKDLKTASTATFTDAVTGAQLHQDSAGFSETKSRNNLAWAVMAGASFDLSERTKLDVGYRYLNLGSGTSGTSGALICLCGSIGSPLKIADIESHEIRIGLRFSLTPDPVRHEPLK